MLANKAGTNDNDIGVWVFSHKLTHFFSLKCLYANKRGSWKRILYLRENKAQNYRIFVSLECFSANKIEAN